jgi:hypothetical protein
MSEEDPGMIAIQALKELKWADKEAYDRLANDIPFCCLTRFAQAVLDERGKHGRGRKPEEEAGGNEQ